MYKLCDLCVVKCQCFLVPCCFSLLRGLKQEGYLIEATFSLWQGIDRGVPIEYTYAVQKQNGRIMETALRCVYTPTDNTVKGTKKYYSSLVIHCTLYVMECLICFVFPLKNCTFMKVT